MVICEKCKVGAYSEFCECGATNEICMMMRRCTTRKMWVPIEYMDKCSLRFADTKKEEEEVVDLKNGEYKVEYIQNNKLYINVDGFLYRLRNPYDYEPKKVSLVMVDGEMYIKEFAPIKEDAEPKKSEKKEK